MVEEIRPGAGAWAFGDYVISILCLAIAIFLLSFALLGLVNAFSGRPSLPGDDEFVLWLFALAALFLIAAGAWR